VNLNHLSKQYNIRWLGTFINLLYMTSPLLGIMMSIVNSITFYAVIYVYLHRYVPWFSFPVFFVTLVAVGFVIIFCFWKFVYPAYYAFLNKQTLTNKIDERLCHIEADNQLIKKHLGIIDDKDTSKT
jgi:hypothetical protein